MEAEWDTSFQATGKLVIRILNEEYRCIVLKNLKVTFKLLNWKKKSELRSIYLASKNVKIWREKMLEKFKAS